MLLRAKGELAGMVKLSYVVYLGSFGRTAYRLRGASEARRKARLVLEQHDYNAPSSADTHELWNRGFAFHSAMHYLSLVKPQMIQQVLLRRGLSGEGKAGSGTSHGDLKVSGEGELMELFPLHPSFDTTKPLDTGRSPQQLQGRCLLNPFGVGEVQPAASRRSESPATTPQKQSSAPLTIFYAGTVNVYDLPADRAQAIMNILGGNRNIHQWDTDPNSDEGMNCGTTPRSSNSTLIWKATPTGASDEASAALPTPEKTDTAPKIIKFENLHRGELPLARRQSLQRFIEKRQNRLNGVKPYAKSATVVNKVVVGTGTKFLVAKLSGVFESGGQSPLA